jgi:hypothetical protein
MGAGSRSRIAAITLVVLFPSNARFPVAISYSTAPKAKMSLLASASLPSICSGDMYWNVPTIMPSCVSGWLATGLVRVRPEAGAPGSEPALASPKSISFAPVLVSITLLGFKSR